MSHHISVRSLFQQISGGKPDMGRGHFDQMIKQIDP